MNYGNRQSKYNAKRVGGFDSKKEKRRWEELKLRERAGEITDLRRQVKYVLIPAQREWCNEIYTKGRKKGHFKPGRLLEKECAYFADFCYTDVNSGHLVVEDVKGYRGGAAYEVFKIKRKLMLKEYGIRIKEV